MNAVATATAAAAASAVDTEAGDDVDDDNASQGSVGSAASSENGALPFRDPPKGHVRLRPSNWRNIPSTVFVEYPPELNLTRDDVSVTEPLLQRRMEYVSHWERVCIRHAFMRAGFEKSTTPQHIYSTALWSKHQSDSQMKGLNCLQKVNHFPASWCVGRKDRLARTMQTMQRAHGMAEFGFHPENFVLPQERNGLHRQAAAEPKSMWILKPCASSCGRGIRVVTSSQVLTLPKSKKALVQRYLHSPYLINGKKFDLRIYVLVSGVDPLRVYIHNEGLTRISTADYSLKNLGNRFAHLTNYSINKKAKVFRAADEGGGGGEGGEDGNDGETEGFKWSLKAFKKWLSAKTSPQIMETTFQKIHDLCVKTMIAAESTITPQLHASANYRSNCFELFGCDVILDSDLNPHLLEVNVSPSLVGSSPLDKRIKGTVIADILHIVGLFPHDAKMLKRYEAAASDGKEKDNPFAFASLSKMMAAQDAWRRAPSPLSVDMSALGPGGAWLMLLSCDDEFSRAKSTQFHQAHPRPDSLLHYNSLYRNARFSDHVLGRWVLERGGQGPLRSLVPPKHIPRTLAASAALAAVEAATAATAEEEEEGGNGECVPTPQAMPVSVGKPLPLDSSSSSSRGGPGLLALGSERPLVLLKTPRASASALASAPPPAIRPPPARLSSRVVSRPRSAIAAAATFSPSSSAGLAEEDTTSPPAAPSSSFLASGGLSPRSQAVRIGIAAAVESLPQQQQQQQQRRDLRRAELRQRLLLQQQLQQQVGVMMPPDAATVAARMSPLAQRQLHLLQEQRNRWVGGGGGGGGGGGVGGEKPKRAFVSDSLGLPKPSYLTDAQPPLSSKAELLPPRKPHFSLFST